MDDEYKISKCLLDTCRYNTELSCTNPEKRAECLNVSRKVLCITSEKDGGADGK